MLILNNYIHKKTFSKGKKQQKLTFDKNVIRPMDFEKNSKNEAKIFTVP